MLRSAVVLVSPLAHQGLCRRNTGEQRTERHEPRSDAMTLPIASPGT
jgi:hypothetical protein